MLKKKLYLPYKTVTSSKKEINFNFLLDENTESPLIVNEIISILLSRISNEIKITNPSNGDIIQALCMALAIRCRIIEYDINKIELMVNNTLKQAFKDAKDAVSTFLASRAFWAARQLDPACLLCLFQ